MDTTTDDLNSVRQRARKRRRRTDPNAKIEATEPICEITLVIVVIGSALAIGTVHVQVLLGVAALALFGGGIALMAARELPKPALVLVAFAAFSALQAVPLPAWLANLLSPGTAQIWAHSMSTFGQPDLRSFPISLDPGASIAEALKWLTYAAVYLVATRVRARRGSPWLAALLFGSASFVTLITLIHGVADLRQLYGLYQPKFSVGRWNVGPLLNANNLAGYAILGLFAGGGLLLKGKSLLPRPALWIGVGVISTALCLTSSRAALVSVLVGGAVTLAWFVVVQRARVSPTQLALAVAPIVCGIIVAIALGTAKNFGELASLDAQRKVAGWRWSLPMIRDHWLLGVGRGAFETALPPYRQPLEYDWTAVFTHAENFVIQWVAEWGIPVGLLATVLIVSYVAKNWIASRTDRVRFMLLTGLCALLLQNQADLGLEIPSVAIAAILALAAGEQSPPFVPDEQRRFGWRAVFVIVPALALWACAFFFSRWPVDLERRDLSAGYRELPVKSDEDRENFREQLHSAMARHPGESYFPLLGALVAARGRDESPLPWLSRSLELAPSNGHAHLVLAQLLAGHRATKQAMLHLRLASQYDRTLSPIVGTLAERWAPTVEIMMEAVPSGPAGIAVLTEACARETHVDFKVECYRQAVQRDASEPDLQGNLADSLILALRTQQEPCGPEAADACAQEAETALRTMARLRPRSWRPSYLLAKLMIGRGDLKGAMALLARACPHNQDGDDCAREAVNAAIRLGSDEAISAAAASYATANCGVSNDTCAQALDWLAAALDAAGRATSALTYSVKAAEADDSASRWLRLANRAILANHYGVARTALERANRSPDASAQSRAETLVLTRRLAQGFMPL